jgi:hypothetical protein
MSVQAAFFTAMRDDKPAAYKAALQRGAHVNFKYDRWIQWNSQCWGLRCQQYLFGRFYTGFSAREYWMAPPGVSGKSKSHLAFELLATCTFHLLVHSLDR